MDVYRAGRNVSMLQERRVHAKYEIREAYHCIGANLCAAVEVCVPGPACQGRSVCIAVYVSG